MYTYIYAHADMYIHVFDSQYNFGPKTMPTWMRGGSDCDCDADADVAAKQMK